MWLRVSRESTRLQSAFYFAFGETLPPLGPDFDLVRFYWNVQLAAAPELVRVLTTRLNRFRVPFRLKCLTIPEHYDRLDSAVLFVQKRYFPITAQLITDARDELAHLLSDATPLFTLRLAAGLGFGFMPRHSVNNPGVIGLPVVEPEFWRVVNLVTMTERAHSPALGVLVREALRKEWFGNKAIALAENGAVESSVG